MIRPVSASSLKALAGQGFAVLILVMSFPALAQTLGQGNDTATPVWRVVSAFVLCVALALLGAWAIRARFQGKAPLSGLFKLPVSVRPERRLLLRETLRLNPQTNLSIVACDGRELLIATSGNDVKLLETLPTPKDKAADAPSDTL
jgi:flagellar biogenesis protein FliO